MHRTESDWLLQFKRRGAYWTHDGNPRRPHPLLTSGEHAQDFFWSELVLENPAIVQAMGEDLVESFRRAGGDIHSMDRVVGPAMGGVKLAYEIARTISTLRPRACFCSYAEKDWDESRTMLLQKTNVWPNEQVLLADDVLTSGLSVARCAKGVYEEGARILPYLLVIVNRTGCDEMNGRRVVSLINFPVPKWTADECPLCKKGSNAIRAKSKQHWELLNATY